MSIDDMYNHNNYPPSYYPPDNYPPDNYPPENYTSTDIINIESAPFILSAALFIYCTTKILSKVCYNPINTTNESNDSNTPLLLNYSILSNINDITDTNCSICLSNYKKNDKITKLTCHHTFHYICLYNWFKLKKDSCPLCRSIYNSNDLII